MVLLAIERLESARPCKGEVDHIFGQPSSGQRFEREQQHDREADNAVANVRETRSLPNEQPDTDRKRSPDRRQLAKSASAQSAAAQSSASAGRPSDKRNSDELENDRERVMANPRCRGQTRARYEQRSGEERRHWKRAALAPEDDDDEHQERRHQRVRHQLASNEVIVDQETQAALKDDRDRHESCSAE